MPDRRLTVAVAFGLLTATAGYACSSGDDPAGASVPETDTRRDSGTVLSQSDSAVDPDADPLDRPRGAARSTVVVGGTFACVLAKDRSVSCWGKNDLGQLGRDPAATPSCGSFPCSPTPSRVEGLPRIARLALGDDFACALAEDGAVWCWGSNAKGQLETTAESTSFTPKRLIVGALDVVATGAHACAIVKDNVVRCWGENTCQIFGKDATTTARILPGVPKMTQLSLGSDAICGTKQDGKVLCWGADHRGSLGHDLDPAAPLCGGVPFDPVPKSVQAASNDLPIADIADVHIGAGVACARRLDGKIICWGDNSRGALGQGLPDGATHARALEVPGVSGSLLDLHGHTPCVIIANRLLCWGDGQYGQLESLSPNPQCGGQNCRALGYLVSNMTPVRDVSSGTGTIAVMKDDLTVWIWGRNTSSELAIAQTEPTNMPCPGGTCVPQPKQIASASLPPLD